MDENTPVSNQDNDLFNFTQEDFQEETAVEETPTATEKVSEENSNKENTELDFYPFLDIIGKELKYNHVQGRKIESKDELITLAQKGLKLDDVMSSKEIQYLDKKAKELGMSRSQYIDEVERFEQQQLEETYENKKQDMLEKGISEEEANEMIEALKMKSTIKVESKRDKEIREFAEEYPDIDYETIPEEILSSDKPLKIAYKDYENKKLKQELEEAKRLLSNIKSSPVKAVTTTGKVEDEAEDDFIKGFNSR